MTPAADLADRWWTLAAPGYDPAVAAVGWHRCLDDLVAGISSGRVLEVGCGPAYLGPALLSRGVGYVGLDRNAAMVARASRRAASRGGAVVRADVTRLPFADRTFDVVVAAAVLGLLDRAARWSALREMVRVTRGEVRLLEPVRRPGEPARILRSRVIALVRDRPLELGDLFAVGLDPRLVGPPRLLGAYSVVRATRR